MKPIKTLAIITAASASLYLTACSKGEEEHDHSKMKSGEHAGHDMKSDEPASHDMGAAKTDAKKAGSTEHAATAAKPYPLKTCLVSDEELGKMGKATVLVHDGQEIKFCCEDCVPKFKADPTSFLAKLISEAKPKGK